METLKNNKTKYRITKGFISFFMLFSAGFSFTHAADFQALGFPNYFRIELSIAKVIGALLLLMPFTSLKIKEWIYAGFMICMISALIAHIFSADELSKIIFVSVDLVLVALCIRYVSQHDNMQFKNSISNI